MVVEACGARLVAMALLAVAREGDEHRAGELRAQLRRDLIAICVGHADVEEHDLGPDPACLSDPGTRAVSRPDGVPILTQQLGERLGGVDVVVDDQDPPPVARGFKERRIAAVAGT
jgi:hypothetical protein